MVIAHQCRRYGGPGAVPPLMADCAPPQFGLLKIQFLEHNVTIKTTDINGKRNSNVKTQYSLLTFS